MLGWLDWHGLASYVSSAVIRLSLHPGKQRLLAWLASMDEMQAADELNADQIRQLLFDLDSGYNAFNKILHDQ